MMGVRGARTCCGTSLQCKDGAVRRGRGAGLRNNLLVRGQLEGSQKTCDERNTLLGFSSGYANQCYMSVSFLMGLCLIGVVWQAHL